MFVSLPGLDPQSGLLPEGEHRASWDEIVGMFSWNQRRRQLLDGLIDGLTILAESGCRQVWLNGSFVTSKDEPGDFDCVWDTDGVDLRILKVLCPEILELDGHRLSQKLRFGGEFLPNIVESSSGRKFSDFFSNRPNGNCKRNCASTSRKGFQQ